MDRSRYRVRVRAVLLVALLLLSASAPALAATNTSPQLTATSPTPDVPEGTLATAGPISTDSGTASSAGTTARTSDGGTIHRTLVLSLTPKKPGEISATVTFEFPSNVRAFQTTLPADSTVVSTTGFSRSDARTYSWDGTTANPRIRFELPANQTNDGVRAARHPGNVIGPDDPTPGDLRRGSTQAGSYSFVDTGPWAIVSVPQFSSNWRYVGDRPTLEKTVRIDGEGATGGEIAYLGAHRTVERTAHGQRFELVIPIPATLRSSPEQILDSLVHASDTLRVGARDEHVFVVAAPTSVDWQAAGIEYGGSDFWVKADERVASPRNVWLHEYVHTRQDYQPATGTRWTTEAGADYYAALLTLHQNRISYTAFRDHMARGTRETVASTVLADPTTWAKSTPYLKGALVYGNVDRQIRVDSDRTRSMQVVLSRMNADPDDVTANEFYSFVESAGNANTRTYAERYAGTEDVPSTWSGSDHEEAFTELPSRISYRMTDVRVTGEYRDESLPESPTLTTGESVTATIEVSNMGGADGTFETALYVDGEPVATSSGTVEAEATRMVSLTHTFDEPGTYTITVAGVSRTIVVADPKSPRVTELAVNASQESGEWTATITVTLDNPGDRPAEGVVPVTLDGETITSLEVSLGPRESTTRTVSASISPGTHIIGAGNVSTSLDIPAATNSPAVPVISPGFGALAALIALVLTTLAHVRLE